MTLRPAVNAALALTLAVSMTGCASIFSGGSKKVTFNSNPPGAQVRVVNEKGQQVAALVTPGVARLDRGAGFFSGANYVANIEKSGYQPQKVSINPTLNGWYIGNLVFGGIIGLFIVDPATGAMFNLSPAEVNSQLVPAGR